MIDPNDLANDLLFISPGILRRTLETCTAAELELLAQIVARSRMITEVQRCQDPIGQAIRARRAKEQL